MKRGGEANMLDNNKTMQEIYSICKKFEEMRLFSKKIPFNSSELQLLKQGVVASEQGQKLISSEIARRLGITRSAVSQMVNKLEEKNIVRRVADEKDRKIAYIELSSDAYKYYEKLRGETNFFFEKLIAKIGEKEMEDFIRVTNIFIDALSEIKDQYAETIPIV